MEIIEKNGLRSILQKIKNLYGGVYGIISQTQTWASDYSGYTMSNLKWGHIPKANMDLFIAEGAEFNDTKQPITKVAPWGEQVQHLPGYFYLNGLGDISYQEMMKIYGVGRFLIAPNSSFYGIKEVRTIFPIYGQPNMSFYTYFQRSNFEVLEFTSKINATDLFRGFDSCYRLRYVGHIDNYSVNSVGSAFGTCYALKRAILGRLKVSISFGNSPLLDLYSIAYMIKYAQTQTIVITLHPDTYARVYINGDASQGFTPEAIAEGIDTALATKTNVTLASA